MDAATIQQAQRGSRTARETLLRELQDVWFGFCLGMLHDSDLARDATQETALRFLRQLAGFRGQSQLRTWSLSIALNVVREIRRQRRLDGDDELDQLAMPAGIASPQRDSLEQLESRAILQAALNELPSRQREAVTLRFFEDLSTEQTATVMGCAAGTVKATLHQAIRALRAKMMQLK